MRQADIAFNFVLYSLLFVGNDCSVFQSHAQYTYQLIIVPITVNHLKIVKDWDKDVGMKSA